MSNYIITTFYTPDYASFVPAWTESVEKFGLKYHIKKRPQTATWKDAALQKPQVIREIMCEHPDKDVVWMDVDGVLVKEPEAFNNLDSLAYDLAARRLKPFKHERIIIKDIWQNKIITTPTLWIANNSTGYELVDAWIASCHELTDNYIGDHINLNIAMSDNANKLKVRFYELPFTYSYCPHHIKLQQRYEETEENRDEAVIVQGIASREHRRQSERCQFKKNIKRLLS